MRYLFSAVILACASMQASALVIEPQKESAPSKKPSNKKTVSAPIRAVLAPPSQASLGFNKAAENANYDMMDLYLQQGADINCLNCVTGYIVPQQLTALFKAIVQKNFQLADWLIQRGADINIAGTPAYQQSTGVTIAMFAANPRIVESSIPSLHILDYVIKNGADLKAVDSTGRNALLYIRTWNLIGRKDSDYSTTCVAFVDQLIQHGIDVNHQDKSGTTALMNATDSCSPSAIKLLLSYGANPELKDKLGKAALDIAVDHATKSSQNSECNEVVKILMNPQLVQRVSSVHSNTQGNTNNGTTNRQQATNSTPQNTDSSVYAGNYSGNYSGDDNGPFQVTVEQDGNIKLTGKSLRHNQAFTGNGKMNSDGSLGISLGNISTGATFQGSINPKTGALYGTWKNGEQAGNFSGNKQSAQAQTSNPIEAIGSLFNVLNKVLAK